MKKRINRAAMTLCIFFLTGAAPLQVQANAGILERPEDGEAYLESFSVAEEYRDRLFNTLIITGTGMKMELVLRVSDLIETAGYGITEGALEDLDVSFSLQLEDGEHTANGMDLRAFLELCGADFSKTDELYVISGGEDFSFSLSEDEEAALILSVDGTVPESGPMLWRKEEPTILNENITRLQLGEDPHYEMHNRPPHDQSSDITFTFQVYAGDELTDQMVYTTSELETLALEHPEAVAGGWYGTIGDAQSSEDMGVGGYLDYYEGIRIDWLLREEMRLADQAGRAELLDRDLEVYSSVDDLSYFFRDPASYYICDEDGFVLEGCGVPVIAYAKNGSPLLPEHEHDSEAYVKYNQLHLRLEELSIEPELGTVKNHSGPFVAAFPDCTDYYGGYQVETAGDCVQMNIYLEEQS